MILRALVELVESSGNYGGDRHDNVNTLGDEDIIMDMYVEG